MTRFFLPALFLLMATGCPVMGPPSAKDIQAEKAAAAANAIDFDENAEINNISNRLRLTSDPGLVGYVLLLNDAGQPILYMSVKGKITSSGKRLTTPYACQSQGENGLQCGNGMAPSDEGTYGTSDAYIYFWSVTGQYYQWNGSYLYSDKPFRTTIAPLVIDVLDGDAPAPSTVPGIHPPAPR